MHFVYISYSATIDKYYIGSTNNLDQRHYKHLHSNKGFTSNANDWILLYHEEYSNKSEASVREIQIKKWKSRIMIERLINKERNKE
jgi:putative endonuclease